ncbi:hypothetical protein [Enterococcus sp. BWR-S5]|uniref:hypothetical protein n=1 Tax=Enterococcus sp. BWR-S5 TaxID=2787714 RepID=UPI001920946B|nr:hypothetical protein [Enterococcus sp. BWR-S5]MBL1223628.1 hypothetical protein [Enterococcus sp. BWR-S5]
MKRKTTEPESNLLERKTAAESFSDEAQGMTTFKTFVEAKADRTVITFKEQGIFVLFKIRWNHESSS